MPLNANSLLDIGSTQKQFTPLPSCCSCRTVATLIVMKMNGSERTLPKVK